MYITASVHGEDLMELIFLDAGLKNKAGHSYKLARELSQYLIRAKLRHRFFGLHSLEPSIAAEIGAIPHFRRSLYDGEDFSWGERRLRAFAVLIQAAPPDLPSRSERRSWEELNVQFDRDLQDLPRDVWNPGTFICVVAISQNQIMGLVRFLLRLPRWRLPWIACNLMFPPSFVPWGSISESGVKYYRRAFELAEPLTGKKLFFTVENEAMRAAFKEDFGLDTRILPLPFGDTRPQRSLNGLARIGFFGDSKCDKGFHLLPEAIALCQQDRIDAQFVVQIQHDNWEPRTIEAERALRALKGVRLLEGILSAQDYDSLTSDIDVMLLPYDPVTFGRARGSAIFTESVASGRPVVATQGTFAGDRISKGEAEGQIFAPHTSKALAGAIARILLRLPACKVQAAERARNYARSHSPEALVEVLLELAKA
jgi:glycosyltransferase involved in cell wall biosynthesis